MRTVLDILARSKAQILKSLYKEDETSRLPILKSLSKNPLPNEPILCEETNPNQILTLICFKFPNPSEEEEPLLAANFLLKNYREKYPLPLFSKDTPIKFCSKTFVSLSLFPSALVKRWRQHGAPHPNFYRKTAQSHLQTLSKAHKALAAHHKNWEAFLNENLSIQTPN
jgi:hypothetical protein